MDSVALRSATTKCRVLLTGGAGFIGCAVIQSLLANGHDVALYDSFTNYIFPLDRIHIDNINKRMEGIASATHIYRGSTENQDCLRRAVNDFRPQKIIHLAAMPLANLAINHPEEAVQSIVTGTLNLLQVARDLPGLDRLVLISSSMIYGDFARVPVREDDCKDPKELYGAMKLSGELVVRAFSRLFDLNCVIVRPSAVYGPTDNNRRVLGIFLENALLGKPLVVKGAEQSLDFTFVQDAADGIVCATMHPQALGQVYNITRGRSRTILEAAQLIAELVPGCRLEMVDADRAMPVRGALDITKAKTEIDFNPRWDIEEGLQNYLEYMQNQRYRGVW